MEHIENKTVIQLDHKKAKALELLLLDTPVRSVADAVGVHESTIYRWIQKDEIFKKSINKKHEVILDNLYDVALDKLETMLFSDNIYTQQYAVSQIMKAKHKAQLDVKVEDARPKTSAELMALFNQ